MAAPIIGDPPEGGGPTVTSEERHIDQCFRVDKTGSTKHHLFLGGQKLATLKE